MLSGTLVWYVIIIPNSKVNLEQNLGGKHKCIMISLTIWTVKCVFFFAKKYKGSILLAVRPCEINNKSTQHRL